MEKSDLIKNLSHDLRTPISIARGYAETLLLKKEMPREESDKFIEIILKKILQVENMVQQLFEISVMESPGFVIKKTPFVLSEIVQETVNTFQLKTLNKSLTLKCVQCQYHVWIIADIELMERVIQNLIDYAIKTTPENGSILMGMEVENKNLIFKIENNGRPFSPELLEWVNNSEDDYETDINGRHTLLELFIAKKILQLHHSSLKAYNKGETWTGLTFSIDVFNRSIIA